MKYERVVTNSAFNSVYDKIESRSPDETEKIEASIRMAKDYIHKLPTYDNMISAEIIINVEDTKYAVVYYIDLKRNTLELLKII